MAQLSESPPSPDQDGELIRDREREIRIRAFGRPILKSPPSSLSSTSREVFERLVTWWRIAEPGLIHVIGPEEDCVRGIDAFLVALVRRMPRVPDLDDMLRPSDVFVLDRLSLSSRAVLSSYRRASTETDSVALLVARGVEFDPFEPLDPEHTLVAVGTGALPRAVAISTGRDSPRHLLGNPSGPSYVEVDVGESLSTSSNSNGTLGELLRSIDSPTRAFAETFDVAAQIGRLASHSGGVSAEHLALAMFVAGSRRNRKSARDSTTWLRANLIDSEHRSLEERLPGGADSVLPRRLTRDHNVRVESDLREVIADAERIRARVSSRDGSLRQRHVLAALLRSRTDGRPSVLSRLRVDTARVCTALLDSIPSWETSDDLDAWKVVLAANAPSTRLEGSIARFATDSPDGQDFLGIEGDAAVLARYLASSSLVPPLSVGVFGEWGAGKSFFMRKVQDAVRELRPPSFCRGVCQIEFNAWHYGEGNLWASLVAHLFENLGLPSDKGPTRSERTAAITKALDSEAAGVRAKQAELAAAEGVERRAEKDLRTAQEAEAVAEREVSRASATEAFRRAFDDPAIKTAVDDAVRRVRDLGFADALDLPSALASGKGTIARIRACFVDGMHALGSTERRIDGVVRLAVLVGLPALCVWFLGQLPGWIGDWRWVGSLLGTLGAITAGVRSVSDRVKDPLDRLEELQKRDEESRRAKSAEATHAETARDEARAEVDRKREEVADAKRRIEALRTDLEKLAPERELREFIKGRTESDDYRKALGTLALVRRDFERLADLLAEVASHAAGDSKSRKHGIDRIILYIDDLDRCEPAKVVDVLQAVHLLLAFPAFVVVVGVDARWVSRALHQRYAWLREDGEPELVPGEGVRSDATTLDYLEKIFQIPIWLRPLGDIERRQLVQGVAGGPQGPKASAVAEDVAAGARTAPEGAESPGEAGSGAGGGPETGTPGPGAHRDMDPRVGSTPRASSAPPLDHSSVPAKASPHTSTPADAGSTRSDLMELSVLEIAALERLSPLYARSPRSVKRLVNCYRVLRAMLPARDAASFFETEHGVSPFEATLQVLALIVGHPSLGLALVEALSLDTDRPRAESVADAIGARLGEPHRGAWARLRPEIDRTRAMNLGIDALPTYRRAARWAARFAFRQPTSRGPASGASDSAGAPA